MFAVHVFDINSSENKSIKEVVASPEVAKILIDLNYEKYPILSNITFIDEELFNGGGLLKIKEEISRLSNEIDSQVQKKFLEEVLELVKLSEDLNVWVLFNPFYES
ncbi:hypothetical protein F889_01218 [Acinetobacter colistiniresistens]|uniref:Uncharacterized protein n=1 Tax=Acinetobacter colistiniresistens TaxID=280145 RepID=N9PPU2_9GAMM|nr:hypothetical protein [Acinetobacter colistiniresistens]ENX35549.1 hypothetical protein F889_01218 [Acinetobacter colistiniresistens]